MFIQNFESLFLKRTAEFFPLQCFVSSGHEIKLLIQDSASSVDLSCFRGRLRQEVFWSGLLFFQFLISHTHLCVKVSYINFFLIQNKNFVVVLLGQISYKIESNSFGFLLRELFITQSYRTVCISQQAIIQLLTDTG